MSTDWNVHCLDCKSTHTFDDANHQLDLMLALCRHAEAIAGLAELVADIGTDIELKTYWGAVDPGWFRFHLGHQLLPISEYGDVYGHCTERVRCCDKPTCHTYSKCTQLAGHIGDHT